MFFAAGLGFSEEKAVKLRNAFSSREIPFGFSWFIICLKKKKKSKIENQPTTFPLVLLEFVGGGGTPHRLCAKALNSQRSPLRSQALLSALVVLGSDQGRGFVFFSFPQLQCKDLLEYKSVDNIMFS